VPLFIALSEWERKSHRIKKGRKLTWVLRHALNTFQLFNQSINTKPAFTQSYQWFTSSEIKPKKCNKIILKSKNVR